MFVAARPPWQGGNLEEKNEPESTSDSGLPGAPLRDKDAAHELSDSEDALQTTFLVFQTFCILHILLFREKWSFSTPTPDFDNYRGSSDE